MYHSHQHMYWGAPQGSITSNHRYCRTVNDKVQLIEEYFLDDYSAFSVYHLLTCLTQGQYRWILWQQILLWLVLAKVSSKKELFKVFNHGKEIYPVHQKHFGSHRGGPHHAFSHHQRKQTGAAALPLAPV